MSSCSVSVNTGLAFPGQLDLMGLGNIFSLREDPWCDGSQEQDHPLSDMNPEAGKEFAMSKGRDRMVSPRADGTWANKRADAHKASSIHKTQQAAVQAAKEMLQNQGGGELTIQGRDGR